MGLLQKVLSIGADRTIKRYWDMAHAVTDAEPRMHALTDAELRAKTDEFKSQLAQGATLDDIVIDAFAVVREASVRTLGMRHFDEQLIAAFALNDHMIAEMMTGSGKSLACTPAVYLNALTGRGVHVVTVNDYLAKRDATQMAHIYEFLGLTCDCLSSDMDDGPRRKRAYAADVTYGTNSEFGFDYLRDNMVTDPAHVVQRGHHFAIVDEVDSILIDEARTPLIISGASDIDTSLYTSFAEAVKNLSPEADFVADEAKRTIALTETGLAKVEARTGLDVYGDLSGSLVNHMQQALKARYLFHRDQEYMVRDGEVLIVDEFTGRVLPGRRYSDGLHQAIEAKEHVEIKSENETLASVTLQNYFRMYEKLAGMTGTALTEDAEFRAIYDLPVLVVPEHNKNVRIDHDDRIYVSLDAKFDAIADEVASRHETGQPCLVGTVSIENSERLSRLLTKRGIAHDVLNAKHHAREAEIVAQAGRLGAVTIATNMAGRGTDIMLGGNPQMLLEGRLAALGYTEEDPAPKEVAAATLEAIEAACAEEHDHVAALGGLCIIGSERHESRRIDNQLRGRAARQGDPGETVFCLSLDDDLLRKFAGERLDAVKEQMLAMPPDEPLHARTVSRLIESAQRRVEEVNYAQRKNTVEYDDVLNRQRLAIYQERTKVLNGADVLADAHDIISETVSRYVERWVPDDIGDAPYALVTLPQVLTWAKDLTGVRQLRFDREPSATELASALTQLTERILKEHVESLGTDAAPITRQVMLKVIDTRWRTYLQEMAYLKSGIGLRGFGQRDPLVEYRREAYQGFETLVATMYEDWIRILCHIERIGI